MVSVLRLSLALPVALFLIACADCGGGGGDAGPDGGDTTEDGGNDGECSFIGGDCQSDGDCCNNLLCGAEGVCGTAPACEDNDSFAGTPAAPATLDDLGDDTPLACTGFPFLDVFSIEANAGEILRIRLDTVGLPPDTQVGQGQTDIDMYLLSGPPTGVSNANGGNVVEGPIVAAGATEVSTETMLYEVTEAGTYYLAVTVWSGPDAEYSLSLNRGVGCDFDVDCPAGDYCRVGVDPELVTVVQECATWTAPGCGEGTDEAGGDVHSDADAVTLAGETDGLLCVGDLDVFSFEKETTERALLTLSSTDLPADDLLVASVVDDAGAIYDVFVLEASGTTEYAVGIGADAGTYYVYLEQFGSSPDEASYDLSLDLQAGCRTDGDCADGRTCGTEIFGAGPSLVCVVASDPCGDDTDNSRTTAAELVEGTQESDSVCMGGFDLYAVELTDPATNVIVNLSWAGAADLDLYVYAEDGTALGAGWYGEGDEEWQGVALTAQTLYVWVNVYACSYDQQGNAVPCTTDQSYTLDVTLNAATVCDEDADCFVGGTTTNDSTTQYTCSTITVTGGTNDDAGTPDAIDDAGSSDGGDDDAGAGGGGGEVDAGASEGTEVQACVRPVPAANFSRAGGEACFDSADCQEILCVDSYCSSDCLGGDADCDATLGADNGYCFELTETPICLLTCETTADCTRIFGADSGLTCTGGECVQAP